MKVKELIERLSDLPDNAEILLSVNCGREGLHKSQTLNAGTRRERHVIIWGDKYQTREVHNAYRANDDRYGGPVLLIEIGAESY